MFPMGSGEKQNLSAQTGMQKPWGEVQLLDRMYEDEQEAARCIPKPCHEMPREDHEACDTNNWHVAPQEAGQGTCDTQDGKHWRAPSVQEKGQNKYSTGDPMLISGKVFASEEKVVAFMKTYSSNVRAAFKCSSNGVKQVIFDYLFPTI